MSKECAIMSSTANAEMDQERVFLEMVNKISSLKSLGEQKLPSTYKVTSVECNNHTIQCIITADPDVVTAWLILTFISHYTILHKLIVGLGVQCCPSTNATATMQLCIGHHCLIFQLAHAHSVPTMLHNFLENPNITFICVDPDMVLIKLLNAKHGMYVSRMVDIRDVAEEVGGFERGSSKWKLAKLLLGAQNIKNWSSIGRSKWGECRLSDEQIKYACVDAFVSFSLALAFKAWNWGKK